MDVKVDDHVRQLWEVKLDAVEHPSLVRVLKKKKKSPTAKPATKSSSSQLTSAADAAVSESMHTEKWQQVASRCAICHSSSCSGLSGVRTTAVTTKAKQISKYNTWHKATI